MLILGIETSCDETSVAVVKNGRTLLSNIISSQIDLHQKTGGVVPEVAAREHTIRITPVIEEALKAANVQLKNIDAIAVTYGPGLLSSLLTGVNAAMTLAKVLKIPLIPMNHIEGHIYANFIGEDEKTPEFPSVVLTASGGHNELVLWKGHGKYKFLGSTLDDAAGEAFDKVARMLGLPYPGGPAIQRVALTGDAKRFLLPRVLLTPWSNEKKKYNYNFSFSGLKTAVLRLTIDKRKTKQFVADVAAGFQDAVCETLAKKLATACVEFNAKEAHLAGGVSANSRLRELARAELTTSTPLRFCTNISLCTDNAAMIACAGYYKYKKSPSKYKKWRVVEANPNLKIRNW